MMKILKPFRELIVKEKPDISKLLAKSIVECMKASKRS